MADRAAAPVPPLQPLSRQPMWILVAIIAVMGLGFIALNVESDFVVRSSSVAHHQDAKNTTVQIVYVDKPIEKIVEKAAVDIQKVYQSDAYDNTYVHIVYSTSCDQPNRHFFSAALQISASKVGQRGPITEIVSGCNEEGVVRVSSEPTFYYDFHRHFTPSYNRHPEPGVKDDYTPYNKPYSLKNFLHTAKEPAGARGNMPIALIDVDFFFFQPLRVNLGRNVTKYYHGKIQDRDILDTVEDGYALAGDWTAYYGGGWFDTANKDKKDIICKGKPCMNVTQEEGREFYAGSGPPYILTKNDWLRMIDDYCKFVVEGRKLDSDWMIEMYGYGLAAGNHKIKHTLLSNLGPTWPKVEKNSWNFLEESTPNPCDDTTLDIVMPKDPPVMIHYCQKYGYLDAEDQGWHFYKYHIPYDILKCDAMILQLPPPTQWTDIPALNLTGSALRGKRHEVWAECTLGKIMNQAFLTTKERLCPLGYNTHQGIPMNEPHKRDTALPGGVPKVKTRL
ncbi:hypothetical protein AeMF1_002377 [Aphanomyces euteiches]|nr:hypothetical protein AeMF1_002377 [Aphanomyces euteiches]